MRIKSIPLYLLLAFVLVQCSLFDLSDKDDEPLPSPRTWTEIKGSDTLRAITIKTCYTAFQLKGRWLGYEYEKAQEVASALGLVLDIQFVRTEREMVDSLFSGAADLAIWPASKSVFDTITWVLPVGPRWTADQVMVSARKLKPIAAGDTLTHYQLSMTEGSRQWLAFHDDSVRAYYDFSPFVIDTIPSDSMTTDQMVDAMIEGRTDMVMLRSNIATMLKTYYPTLKVSEPLRHSTDSVSWIIALGADTLRSLIDSICTGWTDVPNYTSMLKRQYDQSLGRSRKKISFKPHDGALSPYDDIFRKYAKSIGWDWRLLAAIGYIESKLDHTVVSTQGPIGLMQLMPSTVASHGYSVDDVLDADTNVKVASSLLGKLSTTLRNKLPAASQTDLIQFTLASYNAGIGHVYDAIYLADTLGYDTNVWPNNVEHCLRLKSDPNYYSYPNVKLGRFNGAFTLNYISEVLATYDEFCLLVEPDVEDVSKKKKK